MGMDIVIFKIQIHVFLFSEQEIKNILTLFPLQIKPNFIYAFDLLYQETAVKFPTINNLEKAINVIYLCREYKKIVPAHLRYLKLFMMLEYLHM